MKAMQYHGDGGELRLAELAAPRPGPGQIRVDVRACGVCRTDLHVVDDELPNPKLPQLPEVPRAP